MKYLHISITQRRQARGREDGVAVHLAAGQLGQAVEEPAEAAVAAGDAHILVTLATGDDLFALDVGLDAPDGRAVPAGPIQ